MPSLNKIALKEDKVSGPVISIPADVFDPVILGEHTFDLYEPVTIGEHTFVIRRSVNKCGHATRTYFVDDKRVKYEDFKRGVFSSQNLST